MIEFKKDTIMIEERPRLFASYLNDFQAVSQFYKWHPWEDFELCAERRLSEYVNRDNIGDILQQQNKKWHASELTFDNIKKLSDKKTLAVVTGQQAGIFGGPLYTIYKILQCVKTAKFIESKFSGLQCVPVFWMEVGDSDFQEINHIQILNMTNEVIRLSLTEQLGDRRSVYLRTVPDEVTQIFESLSTEFPPNEFRDDVLEGIKKIYGIGRNLADAFAIWIQFLLKDFGVIILNPTDKKVMELTKPLLTKSLQQWRELSNIFSDHSQALIAQGFHNQISLDNDQTLLFFQDDQVNRCRVDSKDDKFILKGSQNRDTLAKTYLMDKIEQFPERFSPNVAFRPILQDYILPSLVYIGGPSEICYAAQLLPLYENFEVTSPIFHPRIRTTLVETKIHKVMNKLGLNIEVFFQSRQNLIENQIREKSDQRIDQAFQSTQNHIQEEMDKLKKIVVELDTSLENLTGKTAQNFVDLLLKFRNKVDQASERKLQTEINQIRKVLVNLFPDDKFQERVFNILQYLTRYGPDFVPVLYEAMDLENWDHQLIHLA
jgi:bacillithiol biosynthesis cysteine-adding enzyme BshC